MGLTFYINVIDDRCCYNMRGEKTKILGKIGDFEIGAKWQWKLSNYMFTFWFSIFIFVLLLLLVVGFIHQWMWFHQISKLQSELHAELEEVKRLKDEIESTTNQPNEVSNPPISRRFKRANLAGRVTAVHLERDVTYVNTGTNGIIGHWQPQYWSKPQFYLENIQLEKNNSSLVIQSTGLYIIYAQVCYATTKESSSFEVRVMSRGVSQKQSRKIAQCSLGSSDSDSEITCFTSLAQVLESGDRVFLQQLHKNQHLLMNDGRSFMGVVKLAD